MLEWRKHEGDSVAIDEIVVEISTDKVDAEVPSPATGTIVKIHAREGETIAVGALLAEIDTGGDNGSGNGATTIEVRGAWTRERAAGAQNGRHRHSDRRRERHRGHDPRVVGEARRRGQRGRHGRRNLDRQGRHGAAGPGHGTITEILFEEGATVTVGQVIARMAAGAADGAAPAPASPSAPVDDRPGPSPPPRAGVGGGRWEFVRGRRHTDRPARRGGPGRRSGSHRRNRAWGADHQGRRAGCRRRRAPRRRPRFQRERSGSRAAAQRSRATWRRAGSCRPPPRSGR